MAPVLVRDPENVAVAFPLKLRAPLPMVTVVPATPLKPPPLKVRAPFAIDRLPPLAPSDTPVLAIVKLPPAVDTLPVDVTLMPPTVWALLLVLSCALFCSVYVLLGDRTFAAVG